jgi:hypothetical protein
MSEKEKIFDHLTLKEKLCNILLHCLMYGADVKRDDDFEKRIQKKMKLEFVFDPTRIRSCLDLIQDTESAIEEFAKFGLQKFEFSKLNGNGEMYLRLYGILNAIYLQMQSIIELFEVLKIPGKKSAINQFKNLKVYEIRNIAGAHTVNYLDNENISPEGFKKNFFRLTHISVTTKSEGMYAVDGFHNIRELNLYASFIEYNQLSEKLLYDCVLDYFNRLIKSEKEKTETLKHYEIDSFTPTDYRSMYKNDKLIKNHHKQFQKELQEEFGEFDRNGFENQINNLTEVERDNMLYTSTESIKKELEAFEKSIKKKP